MKIFVFRLIIEGKYYEVEQSDELCHVFPTDL
jgi:hypothetical protein